MKNKEEYYGVFDYKESDTFRPTMEKRIHKDYPFGKTICTRSDSCCVIMRGGYNPMNEKEILERINNGEKLDLEITDVTPIGEQNLRIRKLTPRECFRLMGLKDADIDLVMENQTNASGYHLAGDSIVTTCLMSLFGQLLGIDWKEKIQPKEWWNNE